MKGSTSAVLSLCWASSAVSHSDRMRPDPQTQKQEAAEAIPNAFSG